MTRIKPRGPTPSLIGSTNGRPRRTDVRRKCECYRCKLPLVAGVTCIEIPKLGTGYASAKRVCEECFTDIIRKTTEDLEAIKQL
jgi:hypothetical protein